MRSLPTGRLLLAVDGNSLAHRAYHAYERRGDLAPDGSPMWAIYGFLSLLLGVIDMVGPDAVVVGFDDPTGSARRDRYPEYKAGRGEHTDDLRTQLAAMPRLLTDLGVAVIVPPALEADDVLASAAEHAARTGWQCVLATSDKDAFGLINDMTTVLRLVSGLKNADVVNTAVLVEQYQVTPQQWRDYATLIGDKSDNLPGVKGIGPKTAVKLLSACGTLDAALADPAAVHAAIGATLAAKLTTTEAGEAIARNRDIMAPVVDLPMALDMCRLTASEPQIVVTLRAWHLSTLLVRAVRSLAARPVAPEKPTIDCPMPGCGAQIRIARLVSGEFRPIEPQPDTDGPLGWVNTSAGWRMRRLNPGEQPGDGRRWRAHACADQWRAVA